MKTATYFKILFLTAAVCIFLIGVESCRAAIDANSANIDPNILANAIFKAEGGKDAQYLYGIRSIKYKDEADARRICLNTINNNKKRFLKQDKYGDYLEFLASKYCPVNCDNDRGTNKYWLKNVRYFLKRS